MTGIESSCGDEEWYCEIFKTVKEKMQNTKKKYKTFDESTKKRPKF